MAGISNPSPDNSAVAKGAAQTDGSQKTQIVDGADNTIGSTANALDVNIKSGSAAGTEYIEDAASVSDPHGGMLIAVRRDTLNAAEVSADGDNIALKATNKGQLHVALADTIVSKVSDGSGNIIGSTANALDVNVKSGATAGVQYTEDAASASDPIGNMLVAVRRDTLTTSEVSADGDNIALKATNKGQLHAKLADVVTVDGSGVTQPVSLSSVPSHPVTNAGTFAVQAGQFGTWNVTNISGTVSLPIGAATSAKQSDGSHKTQVVDGSGNIIGATANALDVNIKSGASAGTQYTEDAAAAADPTGNMLVAVRRDTLSSSEVSADGDNIALKSTNKGQLHVKLADTIVSQVVDSLGNIISSTANAMDVNIKSGATSGTQYTEDAVSAADPVGTMLIAVRRDTLSTTEVSADGDNIALKATNKGQLHVAVTDVTGTVSLPTGAATAAKQDTLLTAITPSGSLSDRSGTIATGGTFQTVFSSSSAAKHRSVQNPPDAIEVLFVKIGSTIFILPAGGYYERNSTDFMPTDSWQVKAATTSHAFVAAEA